MIDFAHPELAALLPISAILGVWWLRRRRPALRYSDLRLVAGLPGGGRAVRARWGGAGLRAVAGGLIVLAAANPRTPDLRTRIPADGIAIVLALDVSGSMATPDFGPADGPSVTRLAAAQTTFRRFVEGGPADGGDPFPGRPTDQIGLVTFAAVPRTACPLTLNHSVLLAVLADQTPQTGVNAGTNVGDALAEALIRLDAAGDKPKVLILLSDGEHNVEGGPDGPLTPRQSAQLAANLNVPVYAIDCGGESAEDQRTAGREVLRAVADMTGGRFFTADSEADLRAVYREIDTLERRPAVTNQYRRYHEYGPWLGSAGVAVLTLLGLLERTRWRRFPA